MGCAGSREKGDGVFCIFTHLYGCLIALLEARAVSKNCLDTGTLLGDAFLMEAPLSYDSLCFPETSKKIRKPKAWKHSEPITRAQLMQMREEFWDTAPHYGGRKEIWDALRAAAEADLSLAQAIVDSAGVIVQNPDLTVCYDERGAKYELPKYVLSEPTNLIHDS
ncbi:UNVERIFIED_CONTAM: Ubiquitin domain-containing protein 2 [Sesamum radiatum]|uniref:Ubiquitin domain-containing protein 2 n=1 Tax=Sesamum radiatum TaxID=300843 RepID=A0AAW2LQA3_SESRA